jgi:hypothetical protein
MAISKTTKYIIFLVSILFPVFLLRQYLTDPLLFVQFSQTSLGKILALVIITVYTSFDYLFGVLAFLLIAIYFQSDRVQNITDQFSFPKTAFSV